MVLFAFVATMIHLLFSVFCQSAWNYYYYFELLLHMHEEILDLTFPWSTTNNDFSCK